MPKHLQTLGYSALAQFMKRMAKTIHMKKLIYLSLFIGGITSCSKEPEAALFISKTQITAKENIEISNTSGSCDIAYINITGNALINDSIVCKDNYFTDQRYIKLCYLQPGTYTIKTTAEHTSFMSGTTFDTKEYTILVSPSNTEPNN